MDSDGELITDNISKKSSIIDELLDEKKHKEDLQARKLAVIGEIERLHREANCKRQAVMMMTGLMRGLDPVVKKGFIKLEQAREKLVPIREKITDECMQRQMLRACDGYKGQLFFDKGSNVVTERYPHLISTLKKDKQAVKQFTDVEHEHRSYHTHTSRYRDMAEYIINRTKMIFKMVKLSKQDEIEKKVEMVDKQIDFTKNINKLHQPYRDNKMKDENKSIKMQNEDQIEDIFEGNPIQLKFLRMAVDIRKNPVQYSKQAPSSNTARDRRTSLGDISVPRDLQTDRMDLAEIDKSPKQFKNIVEEVKQKEEKKAEVEEEKNAEVDEEKKAEVEAEKKAEVEAENKDEDQIELVEDVNLDAEVLELDDDELNNLDEQGGGDNQKNQENKLSLASEDANDDKEFDLPEGEEGEQKEKRIKYKIKKNKKIETPAGEEETSKAQDLNDNVEENKKDKGLLETIIDMGADYVKDKAL